MSGLAQLCFMKQGKQSTRMPRHACLLSTTPDGVITHCMATVAAPLQVVGVLKKEAMKTQSRELEKGAEYRQLLVQVGNMARQAGSGGACAAVPQGLGVQVGHMHAWHNRDKQ